MWRRSSSQPFTKNVFVNFLFYVRNLFKMINVFSFLLKALSLCLHGNSQFQEKIAMFLIILRRKQVELIQCVLKKICWIDFSFVEDLIQVDNFLYEIDLLDGEMVRNLARSRVSLGSINVRLSFSSKRVCSVCDVKVLFKSQRCAFREFFSTEKHFSSFFWSLAGRKVHFSI